MVYKGSSSSTITVPNLVLNNGTVQAFGPRDEVLREQVRNHATIALHPQQQPAQQQPVQQAAAEAAKK